MTSMFFQGLAQGLRATTRAYRSARSPRLLTTRKYPQQFIHLIIWLIWRCNIVRDAHVWQDGRGLPDADGTLNNRQKNAWDDPLNPRSWKEDHVSLSNVLWCIALSDVSAEAMFLRFSSVDCVATFVRTTCSLFCRGPQYAWLVVVISGAATYATCKVWFGSKKREFSDGVVGPDRTYETASPEAKNAITPMYVDRK